MTPFRFSSSTLSRAFLASLAATALTIGLPGLTQAATAAQPGGTVWIKPGDSLADAINSVAPGGKVVLQNGTYASQWLDQWSLDTTNLAGVTVTGASRSGVVVKGLTVKGVTGLTISSMTLTNEPTSTQSVVRISDGSSGITVASTNVLPKKHSGIDIWARTNKITVRDTRIDGRGVTGAAATNSTARGIRVNGAPYDVASWPYDLDFIDNDIFGVGSDMINIGGGRDITISGNDLHDPQVNVDHNDGVQSYGSDDLRIVGNRFWASGGNGPDNAIMLGPSRTVATLRVSNTYIANNLVKSWPGTGFNIAGSTSTHVVNNTVPLMGTRTSVGSSVSLSSTNPDLRVWNNILEKVYGTTSGLTQHHNCVANGASSADLKTGKFGFVDTTNFQLSADSLCRDNGTAGAPASDISGQGRDSLPDRGATEYVGDRGANRFISDLPWVASTNGWGPAERDRANGGVAANDTHGIRMRNTPYDKGVGVASNSSVTVAVADTCATFSAVLGIDDETWGRGSVVFEIWTDGKRAYQSPTILGKATPVPVSIPVAGVKSLVLKVTDAGDGIAFDHADWANAKLVCFAPGTPGADVVQAASATGAEVPVIVTPPAPTTPAPTTPAPTTPAPTTPAPVVTLPSTPVVTEPVPVRRYVSDMTPRNVTNGWGPVERDRANGSKGGQDGAPISLRGKSYAKGLGVHASSSLTFDLQGKCSSFSAIVGVDDEVRDRGSVVFQVIVDGTKRYDSGVLTSASEGQRVQVGLDGAKTLALLVGDGGDGSSYDHADWADAQVACTA